MNQKGFTLIEMMIVLMVISVLLVIAIPNVTDHNSVINTKGCDAYVKTVQAQVQAYELEHKVTPTPQLLLDGGYIESLTCPKGKYLQITGGVVSVGETP